MSPDLRSTIGWATEAGRWYTPAGEPVGTVTAKDGHERPATLRDARKHGWLPSVTTIIRTAAAPGLERWKAEQVLMSALTLSRRPDEPEREWIGRVWQDSQEQGRKAAARGTAIHAAIERHYRGEPVQPEFQPWILPVETAIKIWFGTPVWLPERSFAHPLGYGGKPDLHADNLVLDVKTKEGDLNECKVYDEHLMQLAAYSRGLGLVRPRAGIVFVSRDEPLCTIREATDDLDRGWGMFMALLSYWQAANKYAPGVAA